MDATALLTDEQGLRLVSPLLELHRGAELVARLRAGEARLRPGERSLSLLGGVTLEVGADLRLEAESLLLGPDGSIRSEAPVEVRTPHGGAQGSGVWVEPVEGKVTLSPGQPAQEVLRWSGWGRELVDLGEAVRNWSRSTLPRHSTQVTAVETADSDGSP